MQKRLHPKTQPFHKHILFYHTIHNNAYHHFLFNRLRFSYHDGQRRQSLVSNGFLCLGFIKEQSIILVEKIQEHRSGDTLVAVGE